MKFLVIFSYMLVYGTLECCAQNYSKIMNGFEASLGQFPYLVSLQIHSTGQHFCGGAILNSLHILTAAHCLYSSIPDRVPLPAGLIQVNAGLINLTSKGSAARVKKVFIHEHYEDRFLDNDIAILRLSGKGLQYSPYIQSINLSTSFVGPNTIKSPFCIVAGWGRQCGSVTKSADLNHNENLNNSFENNYNFESNKNGTIVETFITNTTKPTCVEKRNNMLMYAEIPLQNTSECAKDYSTADITDNLICAGRRRSGIDSCKGDSGGPLICDGILEGIISFGDGCDNFNHLGVYTRVYRHLDWIQDQLNSSASFQQDVASFMFIVPLIIGFIN